MLVCHCCKVTDKQIAAAVANGARTVEEITLATGAGTDCGNCLSSEWLKLVSTVGLNPTAERRAGSSPASDT